jgi:hypothetical protein
MIGVCELIGESRSIDEKTPIYLLPNYWDPKNRPDKYLTTFFDIFMKDFWDEFDKNETLIKGRIDSPSKDD